MSTNTEIKEALDHLAMMVILLGNRPDSREAVNTVRTALEASVERQAYDALATERDRHKAALEAANTRIADLTTAAQRAESGEPVPVVPIAEVSGSSRSDAGWHATVRWLEFGKFPRVGTKLYTAPPAAVQPDSGCNEFGFEPMERDDWTALKDLRKKLAIETSLPFTVFHIAIARINRLSAQQPDSGRDAALVAARLHEAVILLKKVCPAIDPNAMDVQRMTGNPASEYYLNTMIREFCERPAIAALAAQPSEQAAVTNDDALWISVLDRLPDTPLFLVRSTRDDDESFEGVQQFEGMWVVRPGKTVTAEKLKAWVESHQVTHWLPLSIPTERAADEKGDDHD